MNCKWVQTRLAEDLEARELQSISNHLDQCEVCRKVHEDLSELEELSKSLSGRFRVPQSFQKEVLARVTVQRPSRVPRLALVGASVLLLIVGMLGFLYSWENSAGSVVESESIGEEIPLNVAGHTERPITFVEVVVTGPSDEELILRLPSVIEIHHSDHQEDFYISNVSH